MWHLTQIPKNAFFYWGSTILPWVRFLTLETFKKHNPDWNIVLYMPTGDLDNSNVGDIQESYWGKVNDLGIPIVSIDVAQELKIALPPIAGHITTYADLFRYVVLNKYGGFYCDMDHLFYKSLDSAPFNNPESRMFDVFMLKLPFHHFVLGAPNANLYKKIIDIEIKNLKITSQVPYNSTECLEGLRVVLEDKVYMLPFETVEENFTPDGPINENAVALNWHGSGVCKKYTEVTEDNYLLSNHPLAEVIRYCLHRNINRVYHIDAFRWIDKGGDASF